MATKKKVTKKATPKKKITINLGSILPNGNLVLSESRYFMENIEEAVEEFVMDHLNEIFRAKEMKAKLEQAVAAELAKSTLLDAFIKEQVKYYFEDSRDNEQLVNVVHQIIKACAKDKSEGSVTREKVKKAVALASKKKGRK